ncbi:acetyltransferase, partial [Staphylococcus aureus]
MIQPTREELINFMKKHGAENVDSITDEQSAIRHFRAQSKVFKDERDEYKKQRDELIEDIAKLRKRNEELENMWRTVKNELLGRYEHYCF